MLKDPGGVREILPSYEILSYLCPFHEALTVYILRSH